MAEFFTDNEALEKTQVPFLWYGDSWYRISYLVRKPGQLLPSQQSVDVLGNCMRVARSIFKGACLEDGDQITNICIVRMGTAQDYELNEEVLDAKGLPY